jgi:hypothetical protein
MPTKNEEKLQKDEGTAIKVKKTWRVDWDTWILKQFKKLFGG